jgi:hypothetical protein
MSRPRPLLLKNCPVEYLDEMSRTAMLNCKCYQTSKHVKRVGWDTIRKPSSFTTFLDFTVRYNLLGYVRIKGPIVPHEMLLHAALFKGLLYKGQDKELCMPNAMLLNVAGFGEERLEDDTLIYGDDTSRDYYVKQIRAKLDLPCTRRNLDMALSDALRSHKRKYRKTRWQHSKKEIFG